MAGLALPAQDRAGGLQVSVIAACLGYARHAQTDQPESKKPPQKGGLVWKYRLILQRSGGFCGLEFGVQIMADKVAQMSEACHLVMLFHECRNRRQKMADGLVIQSDLVE